MVLIKGSANHSSYNGFGDNPTRFTTVITTIFTRYSCMRGSTLCFRCVRVRIFKTVMLQR